MSEVQVIPETGAMPEIRSNQLSHGGGCGCKIAPALLQEILGAAKEKLQYAKLLVGSGTTMMRQVAPGQSAGNHRDQRTIRRVCDGGNTDKAARCLCEDAAILLP